MYLYIYITNNYKTNTISHMVISFVIAITFSFHLRRGGYKYDKI